MQKPTKSRFSSHEIFLMDNTNSNNDGNESSKYASNTNNIVTMANDKFDKANIIKCNNNTNHHHRYSNQSNHVKPINESNNQGHMKIYDLKNHYAQHMRSYTCADIMNEVKNNNNNNNIINIQNLEDFEKIIDLTKFDIEEEKNTLINEFKSLTNQLKIMKKRQNSGELADKENTPNYQNQPNTKPNLSLKSKMKCLDGKGYEPRMKDQFETKIPATDRASLGLKNLISQEKRRKSVENSRNLPESHEGGFRSRANGLANRVDRVEGKGDLFEVRRHRLEDRGCVLEDRGCGFENQGCGLEDRRHGPENRGSRLEGRANGFEGRACGSENQASGPIKSKHNSISITGRGKGHHEYLKHLEILQQEKQDFYQIVVDTERRIKEEEQGILERKKALWQANREYEVKKDDLEKKIYQLELKEIEFDKAMKNFEKQSEEFIRHKNEYNKKLESLTKGIEKLQNEREEFKQYEKEFQRKNIELRIEKESMASYSMQLRQKDHELQIKLEQINLKNQQLIEKENMLATREKEIIEKEENLNRQYEEFHREIENFLKQKASSYSTHTNSKTQLRVICRDEELKDSIKGLTEGQGAPHHHVDLAGNNGNSTRRPKKDLGHTKQVNDIKALQDENDKLLKDLARYSKPYSKHAEEDDYVLMEKVTESDDGYIPCEMSIKGGGEGDVMMVISVVNELSEQAKNDKTLCPVAYRN